MVQRGQDETGILHPLTKIHGVFPSLDSIDDFFPFKLRQGLQYQWLSLFGGLFSSLLTPSLATFWTSRTMCDET
ncbi:hypothetical protein Spb1_36650 [Planctopirus ephydatiae]|uniref:Uncharacterized protein n=1 Tax=Planctopirus ephydatiae TaxID=2528019 RepID=A0A518GT06_9PLAN|nr:hypothetical protein Spb1_36650 [Planctopirus ephydatiae]